MSMRIQITRQGSLASVSAGIMRADERYLVRIRNDGKGKNSFYAFVTAEPWKLNRLLPSLRYAVNKLEGKKRRNAIINLIEHFKLWRAHIASTPSPT